MVEHRSEFRIQLSPLKQASRPYSLDGLGRITTPYHQSILSYIQISKYNHQFSIPKHPFLLQSISHNCESYNIPLRLVFYQLSFYKMAPSAVAPESTQQVVVKQVKAKTPMEMISQGTPLPPVPSFTDFELHRHWILEHMVRA